jgi:predicted nucleic acid-binding protein
MSLVSLDTNILIWAIKEQASPGQEEMILRSKKLLEDIRKNRQRAMVSTIVVSEFLINVDPGLMPLTIDLIEKTFIVVPFDTQSAMMFARIWQEKNKSKIIEELKQSGIGRQQLKADCLIVASAVARKATCIYSHDQGLKRFAEGFIPVQPIPTLG